MTVVLENSELLNAYYDNRALSSLPNQDAYFQFGQIDWGYDFIEEIDGSPSAMDIDLDTTEIASVFYTSDATYNYVDGQIVITAQIPAGAVEDGDYSYQFSCIGIKDSLDNLIAVAVTQPVYIYSSRSVSIEITIETGSDTVTTETA